MRHLLLYHEPNKVLDLYTHITQYEGLTHTIYHQPTSIFGKDIYSPSATNTFKTIYLENLLMSGENGHHSSLIDKS